MRAGWTRGVEAPRAPSRNRGWWAGLKGLRVNEREVGAC
jgi:hypothetical protein